MTEPEGREGSLPLNNGIESVRGYSFRRVDPSALLKMFEQREAILSYFRNHPEMLNAPYKIWIKRTSTDDDIIINYELTSLIVETCLDNPIYLMLSNMDAR